MPLKLHTIIVISSSEKQPVFLVPYWNVLMRKTSCLFAAASDFS
ncbi:hypothetical protein [Pedobacter cryoconitis]|nr:hypothetical protein [Pedobacter cryoconitis]